METGKTLRGTVHLAFDSVDGVTHIVEGMYRNIAATPLPFGKAPHGPAPGIAGLVHSTVRTVNRGARGATELVLKPAAELLDQAYAPGPYRAAVISALNGVCGDHLADTDNPLSISMRQRVFLQPGSGGSGVGVMPFADLFETQARPVEIHPQPLARSDSHFVPGGRILILVHGLCMNDTEWTSKQHNHGRMLADAHGYTPVYTLYNSGRRISENGRELAEQIGGLVDNWPVPVESVSIIGFSMGGLVTRSALHVADAEQSDWLEKVDKVVYLGTPHHGSALERGGFWLQKSMTVSPYSAPLAALGKIRSAGIIDLRHGNILEADWQDVDEHEDNGDHRNPAPLLDNIEHHAIGATLSRKKPADGERLLSDGLVHPRSSLGQHDDPTLNLDFPEKNCRIFHDLGHMALLRDQRVAATLKQWLAPGAQH